MEDTNKESALSTPATSTSLTTIESQPGGALADLRSSAMRLPVERQQAALAEYKVRRESFRDWLLDQLHEGVHYGYPPGCVPHFVERNGVKGVVQRSKNSGETFVPESQWQSRPSFYAAGADFVCDLMGVVDTYSADMDTWAQLGSPAGVTVQKCELKSRATGELIGEGRGAWKIGSKGMYENAGIKMAKKAAKVDAVLNGYGLRDLFTQDLEHGKGPIPEDNPSPHENSPEVPTRDERRQRAQQPDVTKEMIALLVKEWLNTSHAPDTLGDNRDEIRVAFRAWATSALGKPANWNPLTVAEWTHNDYETIARMVGVEP